MTTNRECACCNGTDPLKSIQVRYTHVRSVQMMKGKVTIATDGPLNLGTLGELIDYLTRVFVESAKDRQPEPPP